MHKLSNPITAALNHSALTFATNYYAINLLPNQFANLKLRGEKDQRLMMS